MSLSGRLWRPDFFKHVFCLLTLARGKGTMVMRGSHGN